MGQTANQRYPEWMFEEDGKHYAVMEYADGTIKRVPVRMGGEPKSGPSQPAMGPGDSPGLPPMQSDDGCGCRKTKAAYEHPQSETGVGSLVRGAAGLVKSTLNIGIASEVAQRGRMSICSECEHKVDDKCNVCGCWLSHKTRLTTESCPAGKWGAEKTANA